jgi:tetratricopeptide (TPR) repeat protein
MNTHFFSKNNLQFLAYIFLVFTSFNACSDDDEKTTSNANSEETLVLTEEMCTDFALKLHESFVNNDSTFLNSYINWELIKQKSFEYANNVDSSLNEIIWEQVKNQIYFGRDFAQVSAMGGSLRFVTYYKNSETEHHIILRSFYPPQNINFYDFTLGTKGAFLKVNDIYSYEMACSLYKLLGEQISVYSNNSSSKEDFLLFFSAIQTKIKEAMELAQNGNLSAAYKTFISIDETFKTTQYYQSIELSILFGSIDEKVQNNIIEKRIKGINVTEPGRWLLLFYQSGLLEDYNQARLCIQNLQGYAGQDDILTFLLGVTYFEEGNYEKSLELFNDALATEQDFYIIHYAKITSLIELKKYALAVESLQLLSTLFDTSSVNWDKEFMSYPEFLMSDEFAGFYSMEEAEV